jgi:hypothetical protein
MHSLIFLMASRSPDNIGRRTRGPDGAEGEARGDADQGDGDGDHGLFLPPWGIIWKVMGGCLGLCRD